MIAIRPRKVRGKYRKHGKNLDIACSFCSLERFERAIVEQSLYFYVIKNKFPYLVWDGQRVSQHLMVIPKKHRQILTELTERELKEYATLVAKYDEQGYNTYTRGNGASARSIDHLHTHLIKTDNTPLRLLLFLKKPYVTWFR